MNATTQPAMVIVKAKKGMDWAISSQAPQEWDEGSTTSAYGPDRVKRHQERGAGMAYKRITGIYAIKHAGTDSVYYGSAVCIKSRINMHKRELRNGTHPNRFLQGMWNKYGEEMTFELVEECSRDELRFREQTHINCASGRLMNLDKLVCDIAPAHVHSLRMAGAWSKRSPEKRAEMSRKISETLKKRYLENPEMKLRAQQSLEKGRNSENMRAKKHSAQANAKRSATVKAWHSAQGHRIT